MKIAFDLSAIQNAHRLRGIGQTVANIIENIPQRARKDHEFVFYLSDTTEKGMSVIEELNLNDMKYEVRKIRDENVITLNIPGRLGVLITGLNQILSLKDFFLGSSRIWGLEDLNVFVQCDQSKPMPKHKGQKNVLLAYDLIPYILAADYLWDYKTTRLHSFSRKYAVRQALKRWLYIKKIRLSSRGANLLLAISDQTREDFITYAKTPENKIKKLKLGISSDPKPEAESVALYRYIKTDWGFKKISFSLSADDKFLLYIGGADPRRKIEDIVMSLNHLRARGHSVKLILAGDSMQGPSEIANQVVKDAIDASSYFEDIIFMGFVPINVREWLYANALAFIYPSRYEGFGLPVLEAMRHGTTTICYPNSATKEVAGNLPIYVQSGDEIVRECMRLINNPPRDIDRERLVKYASSYSWAKTSSELIKLCLSI